MEVSSDKINISFRKASILIAVVVFLLLTPVIIIIIIRANNKKQIWVPMISKCPDYWSLSVNDKGNVRCKPGKNNADHVQYIHGFYTYQLPTKKDKYDYSIKNNIVWDGITNDPSLVETEKQPEQKTILWLLGKMFTTSGPNYKRTQDPNYIYS
jgi:hypothetical protein